MNNVMEIVNSAIEIDSFGEFIDWYLELGLFWEVFFAMCAIGMCYLIGHIFLSLTTGT